MTEPAVAPSVDAVPAPPLPVSSPGTGWTFRAAEPDTAAVASADVDLVHGWMQEPHVERWWHEARPRDKWAEVVHAFRATQHALHSLPVIACADTGPGPGPIAYLQVYRVARDRLAAAYAYDEHDLGIHLAIGAEAHTDRRYGREILRAACEGLLAADPRCRRIVAEPDVTNAMSVRAFAAGGFAEAGTVELAEKTAALLVFGRTAADARLDVSGGAR